MPSQPKRDSITRGKRKNRRQSGGTASTSEIGTTTPKRQKNSQGRAITSFLKQGSSNSSSSGSTSQTGGDIYHDNDEDDTKAKNDLLANMKAFPGPDLNIGNSSSPSGFNRLSQKTKVKKITIKNVTGYSGDKKREYFEETSARLRDAVKAILNEQPKEYSSETLYKGVENLVREKRAPELWKDCYSALKDHIEQIVGPLKAQSVTTDNLTLLRTITQQWESWKVKISLIKYVFCYLDRGYLLNKSGNRRPIYETSLALFSDVIINDSVLHERINAGVVSLLNGMRGDSKSPDIALLKDSSRMLSGCVQDYRMLKRTVVSSAADFCGSLVLSPTATTKYLQAIKTQVGLEYSLCTDILNMEDELTALSVLTVKKSMMSNNDGRSELLFQGIGKLADNQDMDWIEFMLQVANSVGLTSNLCEKWGDYISSQCKLIINKQVRRPMEVIPDLIAFYNHSYKVLKGGFGKTSSFDVMWRNKLEETLSSRAEFVAEGLAKYSDSLLKGNSVPATSASVSSGSANTASAPAVGSQSLDELNLENHLQDIVFLLKYVSAKEFYRVAFEKDLARRLLQNNRSVGFDVEENFIRKLTNEFGRSYSERLETMFKDVKNSIDTMSGYVQAMKKNSKTTTSKVEFKPYLLSEGQWPSFPNAAVPFPPDMQELITEFENLYYQDNNRKRKLQWQHSLGSCTMRARFDAGTKELSVNQMQAIILMLFNETDVLSYDQIVSELCLDSASSEQESATVKAKGVSQLKHNLASLSCGKLKVLLKEPKSNSIDSGDVFTFNAGFKHKTHKIRIALLQLPNRDAEQQRKEIRDQVTRDRTLEIQAAGTRIMKSRKRLTHVELVQQIIDQTKSRGAASVAEIKKNIDVLLEREYIVRDESSENTYEYIA